LKNQRKTGCLVAAVVIVVVGICIIASMLGVGVSSFKNQPRAVTGFDFGRYVLDGYAYSSEQQALVDTWGEPHSFTILFYQREDPQGRIETIRHEEWSYPLQSTSVTFENGEEIFRDSTPGAAEIYPTRYNPGQFLAFMSREQLAALTGLADWFILPVEEELVADAELYYAGGLTFGLQDGDLVYVEAVYYEDADAAATAPQPAAQPEPAGEAPAVTGSLTSQEAANQGVHTYDVAIFDGDELIEESVSTIEIVFENGRCLMTEDGLTASFTQTVSNQYVFDDDSTMMMIFHADGFSLSVFGETAEIVYTFQE